MPARGCLPERDERVALLVSILEGVSATTQRVSGWSALPEAVAECLRGRGFGLSAAVAPDPRFAPLLAHPGLSLRSGPALPQDTIGISVAFSAVAEVGTLVLVSGPQSPTSLNFLPDFHVVVVVEETVDGTFEQTWTRLRAAYPQGLPRTLNLVAGPSRTGDIEQTIQLGAHGPRQMHVILVGS